MYLSFAEDAEFGLVLKCLTICIFTLLPATRVRCHPRLFPYEERERETKKTSRGSSSSSLTTGVNENHLSLIQGGFYWQSVWVCFQEHDLQQQQPPVNSLTVCPPAYVSLCPSVNGTASSSPIESPLQIYRSRQKITLVGHSRPVTTAEIWTGKWEFQKWP